jgi:hypothetical protein
MKYENEIDYATRAETTDDPGRWNTEAGYFCGLGDDDSSAWVDAFKEVLPAVASVYQQDQFNKMNIALINAGRQPVSAQQYMATQAPTANVVFGPNDAAQRWIVYGGLGLLALVGLRAAKVI